MHGRRQILHDFPQGTEAASGFGTGRGVPGTDPSQRLRGDSTQPAQNGLNGFGKSKINDCWVIFI